ncbi:hypothetical protein HDU87_001680 [Geranomyces variabilis]|uniref:Uncharacterized protein n=1 Tax=Geranomyces variabilis TaxID=109894 RepID=A0AAD5TCK8_9FUNG|nr:hypothetical protein HDU87_001680 [Geranomyces variabilis]
MRFISGLLAAASVASVCASNPNVTDSALKIAGEARSLWHAHAATVGDYAAAVASDNLPLANAVKPYALAVAPNMTQWLSNWYGDKQDSLNQFQTLFTDHIKTLAGIVDATKANNETQAAELKQHLADGGQQLAGVIESLNPAAYPKEAVLPLLSDHENLAVAAGALLIAQKWDEGYATAITGFEQSELIADALAKGVLALTSAVAPPATAGASIPANGQAPMSAASTLVSTTRWMVAPLIVAAITLM